MRIGICFDRTQEYPHCDGPHDRFAEFEPESTIAAMEEAVRQCGHIPVRLGGPRTLLLGRPEVDVVWNIAEGYGSRNREAWVPVLCELYQIPCLGSDALTLSWSLDKSATKQTVRHAGIPTADWCVLRHRQPLPALLPPFPLFLKPRYEGTAKGISERNIVADLGTLRAESVRLHALYQQDLIAETFLPGTEFTVALSGCPLLAHPVLERGLDAHTRIGFHVMEALRQGEHTYVLHNALTPDLEMQLQTWSVQLSEAMHVLDYARLDFKCDAAGNPFFLEINPLPTFATDNTFAILAELAGTPYPEFLAGILQNALNRVNRSDGP